MNGGRRQRKNSNSSIGNRPLVTNGATVEMDLAIMSPW